MKFIKLDLLTLLISLFLFASCENTSTIGLEVDPNSAVQGDLVDSITINSRTLLDDVTETSQALRHPLGYLKDPLFGTTEASIAMVVNLPVNAYNFGSIPLLDSAVLVLNYGGEFYGDSTATYSIDVHQLDDNISLNGSFPSNKAYTHSSTVLGSKTGKIYPTTKYKVTDIVVGKADTLRTVTPQLRIPINKTFIEENIISINAENLKFNENFVRYLRGFKVQLNKTNSTGNGGLMFFDFAGTNSSLVLYYKKQNNATTGAIDTVSVSFPITTASNPIASTIKHDYTGTAVATQLANPNTQYSTTFLQPLAGLRNKITFPYLSKFSTNVGKIAINKAELVIDLSSGSDGIPYGAAPRLSLYRNDIAERRQNLPDNNTGTQTSSGDPRAFGATVFGGYFNTVTKQYVFVVTAYIQDLLDGKLTDYGTFLAPIPSTVSEFSVFPSISTGARSVVGSFKKTPAAGDNVMKLNIYYTKIK
ncbi:DUF4270 domain-containing protein [Pedobacter polaris]|uniref:DUF4270 domain-containing protein n=1 Tax=Pedobacter polaris TaxID=2571273 RepID=A0A4U1CUG4_9SPHI|nr:DUF4270 domain-containing protein [Pedobacter polaris]TKC12881.1 DUF4270 domain-containing protein [Pedobacter polaris]